jgi:hypothetical protein
MNELDEIVKLLELLEETKDRLDSELIDLSSDKAGALEWIPKEICDDKSGRQLLKKVAGSVAQTQIIKGERHSLTPPAIIAYLIDKFVPVNDPNRTTAKRYALASPLIEAAAHYDSQRFLELRDEFGEDYRAELDAAVLLKAPRLPIGGTNQRLQELCSTLNLDTSGVNLTAVMREVLQSEQIIQYGKKAHSHAYLAGKLYELLYPNLGIQYNKPKEQGLGKARKRIHLILSWIFDTGINVPKEAQQRIAEIVTGSRYAEREMGINSSKLKYEGKETGSDGNPLSYLEQEIGDFPLGLAVATRGSFLLESYRVDNSSIERILRIYDRFSGLKGANGSGELFGIMEQAAQNHFLDYRFSLK